jgi:broad specificity phosphatase PhoE
MKEIYVIRHGEKDATGMLTERGMQAAQAMRSMLPGFACIISSDTSRTALTANLLTGEEPRIDHRAAFAMASPAMSNEINDLAAKRAISFLDAARLHNNPEVLAGIDGQAHALNALIDELFEEIPENEKALIVSHDLTIVPAMAFRGMSAESIDPLSGYIVRMDDETTVQRYPSPN